MNRQKFVLIFCFILILFVVALYGYQLETFTGFPKGADAYARITRIVYLLDFFPHVFWQYHWADGMPTFKTEAPLFYFLGAIIAKIFSGSPFFSLIILGFLAYAAIGIGVFGFVLTQTRKPFWGLFAAILALSSFSLWSWMLSGGIYPRILGVGFSLIAFWFTARFLKAAESKEAFPRKEFAAAALALGAALTTHALMGLFIWIAIFFLILVSVFPLKKKIKYGFLIYLSSFSVAGFFFLPLFLSPGGASTFIGVISPVVPAPLYYLIDFAGMGPFVLPLLAVVLILGFLKRLKPEGEIGLLRLIFAPLVMFLLFSAYALIGYTGLSGKYYYINGFIPLSATLFMTLYGSILIGLLLARLQPTAKRVLPLIGFLLIAVVWGSTLAVGVPLIKKDDRQININDTSADIPQNAVYKLQRILKFPQAGDFNHRFAAFDADEAVWFNTLYKIPQVRDYYGQGILYPDWRYWFEQALWDNQKFSLDEARSALDWFAVRWFSTYERSKDISDYEAYNGAGGGKSAADFVAASQNRYLRESGFNLVSYGRVHYDGVQEQFEVENPGPILSATSAPTVLYIGDPKSYNLLFTNLTFTNYNSSKLIPVRGKLYLDDYTAKDFKAYTSLVLFGYRYRDQKRAYKILTDYLNEGGNILWEAWDSPELLNEKGTAKDLPEPSPFSLLNRNQIQGTWDFQKQESPFFNDVDLTLFSPPLYNGAPWKMAKGSNLKPWAKVVLDSKQGPLVVSGKYGKGKIVWTSFNFLYHTNAYKNFEEAKLLRQFFTDFAAASLPNSAQAAFINPEKREILISERAAGVLFKESYYPSWKAYALDGKNKKTNLHLELAGPGMMYASLPKTSQYPLKVTLEYTQGLAVQAGLALTLLSILFLIFSLFNLFPAEKMKIALGRMQKPLSVKTKTWLNDEDS
ncbi:MAG: hypothetical protein M1575_03090 [Patescibacteria group bacterium]|nr:hypothetical protein [Patescibacteria group bacterium]MCL5095688.1 hypothetical protein [Patescibacteria group bacterium]